MKDYIIAVAIMCLTILELYALHVGIDGVLFMSVIGVIGAILGIHIDKEDFYSRIMAKKQS